MILVKGMTRRVVVVKSPDKRLFEEAVFFLCDDAEHGVSSDQIIAEAQSIANGFTRDSCRMRRSYGLLRATLWTLLGAIAASLVWLSLTLLI